MTSYPMYAPTGSLEKAQANLLAANARLESATRNYTAQISAQGERLAAGKKMFSRHKQAALRVSYERAKVAVLEAQRRVAMYTS